MTAVTVSLCGFVERQLQAADVAPVDAFWLRRIAAMRDLRLASRTFPWNSDTIEAATLVPRGPLPSLRSGGMGCAKKQAVTVHPPPLPPCPRCLRLTGVEEDENTGSSLRWFICRLCGHCWSAAPQKLR
jgi:hypothetical protein